MGEGQGASRGWRRIRGGVKQEPVMLGWEREIEEWGQRKKRDRGMGAKENRSYFGYRMLG